MRLGYAGQEQPAKGGPRLLFQDVDVGGAGPDTGVPIHDERADGGLRGDEDFGASAILMGATRREDKAS